MNEPSPANLARRPKQDGTAFRVLGVLAIAFGTLQASLLVVSFPPHPHFAPGIYFGIAMGILGIPVFLLVRWAAVIFVAIWIALGLFIIYALVQQLAAHWGFIGFMLVDAALMIVMPATLLRSNWSSLR